MMLIKAIKEHLLRFLITLEKIMMKEKEKWKK